jgi:hypothetical protein
MSSFALATSAQTYAETAYATVISAALVLGMVAQEQSLVVA